MSLDLTITSKSTGNVIFDGNITHNMAEMAKHVVLNEELTLYQMLWQPHLHSIHRVSYYYTTNLRNAIYCIVENSNTLKQYEPSNGWGNWITLLNFICDLYSYIKDYDGTDEWKIHTSY